MQRGGSAGNMETQAAVVMLFLPTAIPTELIAKLFFNVVYLKYTRFAAKPEKKPHIKTNIIQIKQHDTHVRKTILLKHTQELHCDKQNEF